MNNVDKYYVFYKYIMKSALIITGNIRSFESCFEYFYKLISVLDCDVFICMSNVQFDLHTFNKSKLNFYNDIIQTREMIIRKLGICKNMRDKIKQLTILDKIDEDYQMHEEHIHKLDDRKTWKGIDIFKQYDKINTCVDFITDYENTNGIVYDYIVKTRFDIEIDISSLPTYPLANKTIYSNIYGNGAINDILFITNSIANLKMICQDVRKHFYHNTGPLCVYDSIQTLLYHIFETNTLTSVQITRSSVHQNYHSLFNTNVTLVTCFYNINREKWDGYVRSVDTYFKNAEKILAMLNPIVIFTTSEYLQQCLSIRKKIDVHLIYTEIIILPFEKLLYYDKINQIREIQQKNIDNIPNDSRNCPEFCVPEYIIVIHNKSWFLKKVSETNTFDSLIFQWVDFGLHSTMYNNDVQLFHAHYFSNIYYKPNKIRVAGFIQGQSIHDKISYYNSHLSTLAATLVGGDKQSLGWFHEVCNTEFTYLLSNGVMNQEQYIYYHVICNYPHLFDYTIMSTWDNLCKTYATNTTNVAICMSGHTRTFHLCKSNIYNNIIKPLETEGCHIYIYFSTWNDTDFQNNLDDLQNKCKMIECDNDMKEYFNSHYSSRDYLNYPGLSCDTTCANASSSHYKMYKSYELSKQNALPHDVIIRIRPDIIYNTPIDIGCVKQSLFYNYVYMPYSHGKYRHVTKMLMDHYFYGNATAMGQMMDTFGNIQEYMSTNCCPHTCEGFMYKNISDKNILIYRVCVSYGKQNGNNRYEVIYH
jgi:hypothetical protein